MNWEKVWRKLGKSILNPTDINGNGDEMKRAMAALLVGLVLILTPIAVGAKATGKKGFVIVGKWGYKENKEAKGYFLIKPVRKIGKGIIVKGFWNSTESEEKGRIFGLIKRCFFNGVIRTKERLIPVVGLLKINKEKRVLIMKWMTPRDYGWAIGKVRRLSQELLVKVQDSIPNNIP